MIDRLFYVTALLSARLIVLRVLTCAGSAGGILFDEQTGAEAR